MPTGQGLADLLSGAAGAPVNRPALEAFVANSQAKNGLVSAQTQEAMIKASQAQEQMTAWNGIKTRLIEMGAPESEASLARDAIVAANNHDPVTGMKMLGQAKLGYGDVQSQTAGQQMFQGKEAGPIGTPANFQMPPGSPLANVPIQQSPQGAAQTAQTHAMTGLDIARAEEEHSRAVHANQPGSSLDSSTADMGADVVMADPTKMSQFGSFGQNGQAIKTQINNRIAQKLQAAGMQPTDMIRQRAIAKASIGSAGQAAKQAEVLDAFMPLVKSNGDRIIQLLEQVGDDGANMPVLAGLQRALGRNLGSADLAELHSVFTTYQNEVSRLLAAGPSMNGVISDHARSEIQGMAPENMTTAQARRVINRVNTETGIRRNSVQSALVSSANEQLPVTAAPPGGASPQSPSPAAGGATGAPIPLDQFLKSKGY